MALSSWSANNIDPSNMADDFTEEGQVIAFFRWQRVSWFTNYDSRESKPIHENLGARIDIVQEKIEASSVS